MPEAIATGTGLLGVFPTVTDGVPLMVTDGVPLMATLLPLPRFTVGVPLTDTDGVPLIATVPETVVVPWAAVGTGLEAVLTTFTLLGLLGAAGASLALELPKLAAVRMVTSAPMAYRCLDRFTGFSSDAKTGPKNGVTNIL